MGCGRAGKSKGKNVLSDEEYVQGMRTIIKRDFFPDYDILEAQYNLLRATDRADREGMRLAQQQMDSLLASDPSRHVGESLDEFLAHYTSEDNASFERVLEKMSQKNIKQHLLVLETEKAPIPASTAVCLRTKEQTNGGTIDHWNHTKRNSLMFIPDGRESSKIPADYFHKNINHSKIRGQQLQRSGSHVTLHSTATIPNFVPNTPLIVPSAANLPMTWGLIEGTPIRLPESPVTNSKTCYKLPPTPKREFLANTLLSTSDKSSKGITKSKNSFPIPKTPKRSVF